jgi:hypothetical protein
MAEKLEIRLVIKPDGTVELTTHGLKGEECLTETKELEKAVGRVTRRTKTSEYHAAKTTTKTTVRDR